MISAAGSTFSAMLFKRRTPLAPVTWLKHALWPRRGWARTARYIGHRVGRLPGTPYRIAAGFASGAAVSMTPLIGLHFVAAAILAWLTRGNIMASAIGTVVGNPWTFPFIWAWTYGLGHWLLGHDEGVSTLPPNLSFGYIFDNPWQVLWPMFVGSLPTAALAWGVAFWPSRRLVSTYQAARRRRLERREEKRLRRIERARQKEALAAAREHQG